MFEELPGWQYLLSGQHKVSSRDSKHKSKEKNIAHSFEAVKLNRRYKLLK